MLYSSPPRSGLPIIEMLPTELIRAPRVRWLIQRNAPFGGQHRQRRGYVGRRSTWNSAAVSLVPTFDRHVPSRIRRNAFSSVTSSPKKTYRRSLSRSRRISIASLLSVVMTMNSRICFALGHRCGPRNGGRGRPSARLRRPRRSRCVRAAPHRRVWSRPWRPGTGRRWFAVRCRCSPGGRCRSVRRIRCRIPRRGCRSVHAGRAPDSVVSTSRERPEISAAAVSGSSASAHRDSSAPGSARASAGCSPAAPACRRSRSDQQAGGAGGSGPSAARRSVGGTVTPWGVRVPMSSRTAVEALC